MKSGEDSHERREQFVQAVTSGNWEAASEQFISVLAERDKLFITAKALCIYLCRGNEQEAEATLIRFLNQPVEPPDEVVELTPEQVRVGTTIIMSHSERQEFLEASPELRRMLGWEPDNTGGADAGVES